MKNLLRAFGGGAAVGVANVIPGVSGGTMMTIMNIFDRTMSAISGLAKKGNKNRLKDILFLLVLGGGALTGIVLFSKLLEWLFAVAAMPTVFWFVGLVALSVPVFKINQMKGIHIHWPALALGALVVAALTAAKLIWFPDKEDTTNALPAFELLLCLQLLLAGTASGFSMLLPGVSGSLVLMILGLYETVYFAYINNASTVAKTCIQYILAGDMTVFMPYFTEHVIKYIPAAFFAVGVLLGIFLSAKITDKALARNKRATLSFLLGLVAASAVSVVLLNLAIMTADVWMIVGSVGAFAFGGGIVWLLGKVTAD